MTPEDCLAQDKEVMGGSLCFRGRRIPAGTLMQFLRDGGTVKDFADNYELDMKDVVYVMQLCVDWLENLDLKEIK